MNGEHAAYRRQMMSRFAAYRDAQFAGQDSLFDPAPGHEHVFRPEHAERNLFDPELGDLLPGRRHRWFAAMSSSQALALSIFGTIIKRSGASTLAALPDERGALLLPDFAPAGEPLFDYPVTYLGEPRPTQVDFYLPGKWGNVAIECKLGESEWGACSQVPVRCDGNYAVEAGPKRGQRCTLSARGVQYWQYLPRLFLWQADVDYRPCPIREPYQLVRNVLAAAVSPGSDEIVGLPVAMLVCDARNPVFAPGGSANTQFLAVRSALWGPASVRRTTWQDIARALRTGGGFEDLLTWLEEKYGIVPDGGREP